MIKEYPTCGLGNVMRSGLPTSHGLSEEIRNIEGLLPGGADPCLTDIQYEALEQGVARGASLLVAAPTSTGKTLIGLWTIAQAVAAGARAIYLVSHRALAKQKFEEILATIGAGLLPNSLDRVVLATGDGVENGEGQGVTDPLDSDILIATYEKFLHSLATSGPPRDMGDACFIADEIQLVGDEHRGAQVELLLTLLKRAGWRQFVGLSAVLSERDAYALAGWLGVGCLRNPKREKNLRVECRTDHANYISVVDAERGPQPLQQISRRGAQSTLPIVRELIRSDEGRPVIVFCMRLNDTYELAQSWVDEYNPGSVDLIPPEGADIGEGLLEALRRRTAFHNAELGDEERELVERQLAGGHVDAVFATTTLAAGVNFPLGSAVFDRFKRWDFSRRVHVAISRPEFHNMAGRVGRMGQRAAEGVAIMVAPTRGDLNDATRLMNFASFDDLTARIQPEDFGQLVLHIFAGKLCGTRDEAYELLAGTFSAAREIDRNRSGLAGWREKVDQEIDQLIEAECLTETRKIDATMLGSAIARTGLKPQTVRWLLIEIFERSEDLVDLNADSDAQGEDSLAFILAQAALSSPEFDYTGGRPTRILPWRLDEVGLVDNPPARALADILLTRPWSANTLAANGSLLLDGWVTGRERVAVEGIVPGVRWGNVQAMGRDVAWILFGLAEVIQTLSAPNLAKEVLPLELQDDEAKLRALRRLARTIRRQSTRFMRGLPPEVLWLTSVELDGPRKNLSRREILALRAANLIRPLDLMRGDPAAAEARASALSAVGVTDRQASSRLRDAVRGWKAKTRRFLQRTHQRLTKDLDGGALVKRLYEARGNQLEAVLEEVFAGIGVKLTKLDDGTVPGSPDYLLEIEDFHPIVVEVKSKASDSDFVGLNGATEILAASELLGHRDSPCLTICSPAVDPSVAGAIERCRRLCVVDVSDLCGAAIRLRQGRVSKADLYSWLTTPGIATFADLTGSLVDQ
jgi:helicase